MKPGRNLLYISCVIGTLNFLSGVCLAELTDICDEYLHSSAGVVPLDISGSFDQSNTNQDARCDIDIMFSCAWLPA